MKVKELLNVIKENQTIMIGEENKIYEFFDTDNKEMFERFSNKQVVDIFAEDCGLIVITVK